MLEDIGDGYFEKTSDGGEWSVVSGGVSQAKQFPKQKEEEEEEEEGEEEERMEVLSGALPRAHTSYIALLHCCHDSTHLKVGEGGASFVFALLRESSEIIQKKKIKTK